MPNALYDTPLDEFLIPNGYQENRSDRRNVFTFQYTGTRAALLAAIGGVDPDYPFPGEAWGDAPGFVTSCTPLLLSATGDTLLTVVVEDAFLDGATIGTGNHTETSFELETATIYRPILEHPFFQTGGTNALTFSDHVDLMFWRGEPTYANRSAYKYTDASGGTRTLSTNAQRAARYLAAGIEQYADMAPVARRTKRYVGGPPPSSNDAGIKQAFFSSFPGGEPGSGLEWLNTGERGLRSAGTRDWYQTTELTAAKKILVDRTTLYLA